VTLCQIPEEEPGLLRIKKRTVLSALLLVVVTTIGGTFLLRARDYRITQANCHRIKPGMSLEEVEAILGPPGDYTAWPQINEGGTSPAYYLWWGEDGVIVVQAAGREHLVDYDASFVPRELLYDSRPRRVCRWLRDRLAR
jgi:hypothetical protein